MQFQERHEFPRPRQAVLKMFSDVRYFKRKFEMTGARAFEVLEEERVGDHFRIRYRFHVAAQAPLPDFVKKFVRDSMQVMQEDSWDLTKATGRLDIEIRGVPVSVSCDMKLEDTAGGCVNLLNFSLKCSVPLLGGKIEKVLAQDVSVKSKADRDASLAILEDY